MSSPPVLDFEKLLAPIPGDSPAGVDAREGKRDNANQNSLDKVKSLKEVIRRAEDPTSEESQGKPASHVPAEWEKVLTCSADAIAGESKDFRFVSPLLESLVRRHGFAGLRDGFQLTCALVENYWDQLHPRPDEDGIASMIQPLDALFDGPLGKSIEKIPLTNTSSNGSYVLWQYRRAEELEQISDPEKREQRLQSGWIDLATFNKSARETPKAFYEDLVDHVTECRREFERLDALLNEKCEADAPPTTDLKTAILDAEQKITEIARQVIPERFAAAEAAADDAGAAGDASGNGATTTSSVKGREMTRADAFAKLREVAAFFERTEPQSMIPFALRQVEKWGNMSLPDLLTELISDSSARSSLFKQVGIPDAKSDTDS